MKILSPMSEDDAAEQEERDRDNQEGEEEEQDDDEGEYVKKGDKWSRKVERALVRLSAEIAALREQITAGREWRTKKEKSPGDRSRPPYGHPGHCCIHARTRVVMDHEWGANTASWAATSATGCESLRR